MCLLLKTFLLLSALIKKSLKLASVPCFITLLNISRKIMKLFQKLDETSAKQLCQQNQMEALPKIKVIWYLALKIDKE